jgi:membrane-bound lytic murein transglycosylase D
MLEYFFMSLARFGWTGSITFLALALGACASRTPAVTVVQSPAPEPSPAVVEPLPAVEVPPPDPIAELIALSNTHFEAGQSELKAGHLEGAKTAFSQALMVLLESSFGARSEPRLREHFDRLVERISAYELTALAEGDGFTEKNDESASIDELVTLSTEEPVATTEVKEAVEADLEAVVHDIDIPLNPRVLSYVQLFTGRLKRYLEEGLSRGARYLPMIQDVFRAEGLPLDLAYIPLVESAFKPTALSRAKAKGVWQFMRGTGLENGLSQDWYIDERAEPEKATRAAAKYLKTLYAMFGDWHLVLASYNGGPGRVQRAMKSSGRKDFWRLSASTRLLPRETRNYVPLVLASIVVARNPVQYGLEIEPTAAPEFELITVPAPTDLRRVAEWAGTTIEAIQDLNPELRRWTTPIRATNYDLRVPYGSAQLVLERLASPDSAQLASLSWHTVRKGETLLSISRKLKVSRTDLAEANYLSIKDKVNVGQQLVIPRPPTLLLARAESPAPPASVLAVRETPAADPPANSVVASVAAAENQEPEKLVHRVRRGDTLFSIAKLYQTTVSSLKSWNRIRGSVIRVGDRLTVFSTVILPSTN